MNTVPTFTAVIWIGTKHRTTGLLEPVDNLIAAIQAYTDKVGLCVSVTPTTFIYTKGSEPGLAVGLINYPRFPLDQVDIVAHAMKLAQILKDVANQLKVSVVMPDWTTMISTEPA